MELIMAKKKNNSWVYSVKEGNETRFYTVDEMAEIVGVTRETMNQRSRVYEPDDQRIIAPKRKINAKTKAKTGNWGDLGTEVRKKAVYL